ncbi:hypothetical protein HHI36_000836 [Cryptolaemus montrouzieri]|uniref:Lipocalin/cytosolic fatty-acid binding domain-containing protein n=1 Tax=Cryptolaemus montrouzieri TaxID=559131 RepID=A0ABD2P6I6_9CUCU
MFKYSALILVFTSAMNCQVPMRGQCPDVGVQPNFEFEKQSGTWYLIEAYYTEFLKGGKCVKETLTPNPNGTLGIELTQINSKTGKSKVIKGISKMIGENDDGVLLESLFGTALIDARVDILDTDSDSYVVKWSCQKDKKKKDVIQTIVWIESRKPELCDSLKQKIYKVLDNNGIKKTPLSQIEQKDKSHTPIIHHPDKIDNVLNACCVLPNFVGKWDGLNFEASKTNPLMEVNDYGRQCSLMGLHLREYFAAYFMGLAAVAIRRSYEF